MTREIRQSSSLSRRSLLKGAAGAASLAAPFGTMLARAPRAFADKKVTVGMAWPGMQMPCGA